MSGKAKASSLSPVHMQRPRWMKDVLFFIVFLFYFCSNQLFALNYEQPSEILKSVHEVVRSKHAVNDSSLIGAQAGRRCICWC